MLRISPSEDLIGLKRTCVGAACQLFSRDPDNAPKVIPELCHSKQDVTVSAAWEISTKAKMG